MLNFKKLKIKPSLPQVKAYSIVLLALIFAGSLSFVLAQAVAPKKPELSAGKAIKTVKKADISPSPTPETLGLGSNQISQTTKATLSLQPTIHSNKTETTGTDNSTRGSNPSPTSPPAVNIAENNVTVSINGGSSFDLNVSTGANQCDVLTKAMDQGKIQSLNMRYENSYGSNAVYQINGIGKENSVWWTFKVNGDSPSQGCSYIKANNGDNVEWKYIGT